MTTPRILYITSCWPHAKAFGSQMRVLQIARTLQRVGEVSLAVTTFPGAEDEGLQKTQAEFHVECYGKLVKSPRVHLAGRLRRAIDPKYPNPDGYIVEHPLRACVLGRLESFDLVWISTLRTANAFQQWHWGKSVMDIDDIPSTYQRTLWRGASTLQGRLRAGWRMLIFRQREKLLRERFAILAVCSDADREYLKPLSPVHVIPNGFPKVDLPSTRRLARPPRLGFIGQFNYYPNSDGVRWFAKYCWPILKREVPELRLRLIGNGTDGPLKPAGPDIDAIGWVADPSEEVGSWAGMIVPVFVGAGTRVKVAEAFSRKCPLISTHLGAFGYNVKNEAELLLADSADDFVAACLRIVRNSEEAAQMAERAWSRFTKEWTWDAISPRILRAAEACLEGARS